MTVNKITTPPTPQEQIDKINEIIDAKIENKGTQTSEININGSGAGGSYTVSVGYNNVTGNHCVGIGSGQSVTANWATCIGCNTACTAAYATSLGSNATASANAAIQLGYGTNSTAKSLSVGFYDSSTPTNYQLLNGANGLIPDARLSSNIARISDFNHLAYTATCPAITISDGIATWTITHNLSTQNIVTSLYNSSGNEVEKDVLITSNNTISVAWKSSANVSAGDFKIVVLASGGTVSGADTNLSNITNTGKSVIAHDALPSATYNDLTFGASGTQYTAPADGWFFFFGQNSGSNECYIVLINITKGYRTQSQQLNGFGSPNLYMPVNKGDVIEINYGSVGLNTSSGYQSFRFYYANGSSWEAS